MSSICKFMHICKETDPITGFVVEKCVDTFPALDGYVVVVTDYDKPQLRSWIEENVNRNVEHCLKMYEETPVVALNFVRATIGIKTYTSEIIDAAGGVQNFLDSLHNASSSVSAEVSSDDISEIPDIEDAIAVADESTPVEEVSTPAMKAEDNSIVDRALALAETAQKDAEAKLASAEEKLAEAERLLAEANELHTKFNDLFDKDLNFVGLDNPDMQEKVLARITELNSEIDLGNLSPEVVLTVEDMEAVSNLINNVSPSTLKQFMLKEASGAVDFADRARFSVVMNDLAAYLGGDRN